MNRRTLIRTVTLGAAGAAFSGPLSAATKTTGLVEAPNLAAQLAVTMTPLTGNTCPYGSRRT